MRVCNVAICTLTALVTGGIVAEAHSEIMNPQDSSSPQNEDFVIEDELNIKLTTENMIAAPEVLEITAWSANNSEIFNSSNQNTDPVILEKTEFTSLEPIELETQNPEIVQSIPVNSSSELTELESQNPEIVQSIPVNSSSEIRELETQNSEISKENTETIASEIGIIKPEKTINNSFISEDNSCNIALISEVESEDESEINLISQANNQGCSRPREVAPLEIPEVGNNGASPALSINIPVGYGADNNTVFLNTNYQASVREDDGSVFNGGIGVGLGDASEAIGSELSYAFATNDNFGEGGFNVKLHHRFEDDLAVAIGWNGLLNIGRNDFEHSKYGTITKVFRLQDSLDDPFSRIAFTAGVGDGQFRSNGAVKAGDNNVNVFGNMAVRMFRPVSFIAEWTGQDVGLGLSIAPFENIPLVITPAVRDLAGNDYNPRFVVSMGLGFQW